MFDNFVRKYQICHTLSQIPNILPQIPNNFAQIPNTHSNTTHHPHGEKYKNTESKFQASLERLEQAYSGIRCKVLHTFSCHHYCDLEWIDTFYTF